ncbi:MAG: PDZ domain-containing protein [Planctomycetes bacterium]|nr:PDZ domain-containing protein [Planctomycetota bacterium]
MTRIFALRHWWLLALLLISATAGPSFNGAAQPGKADPSLPADWTKAFVWRNIGPANMSGRITALAVYEADPSTYWVATASGGLVKTINNGVTFEHQFDKETTVSIGDVCVAPSNRDIVWVGTGEANPRNSVSYGDGVYKSTDGGKSWKNMGLDKTFQIGRIAIHPKNPDIVYVGALGRLYGSNPERGLFKTTDGGKTWDKVLFLNDRTGVIDIAMNPSDPDTLLVAMWERRRDGYDSYHGTDIADGYDGYDPIMKWGEAAGIYKTTDGGKSFKKLTTGLPSCKIGRVGLDYFRKDPSIVYAIVDSEKIGMGAAPKKIVQGSGYLGFQGEDANPGAKITLIVDGGPASKAGLQIGDVVRAVGKKEVKTYDDLVEEIRTKNAGDKLVLKVKRDDATKDIEVTLGERPGFGKGGGFGPGGPKPGRPYHAYYGGQKENVQDQQGPGGHEYGGVYKSTDGGESWTRVNSLNSRPMYFSVVRVDPQDAKYVYALGVVQYRSSDGGKTFKGDAGKFVHADGHALWINPRDGRHMLVGTDGGFYVSYDRANNWDHLNHLSLGQFYHVAVNNKRPYWAFGGLQDNGTWGGPTVGLKGGVGPINEDWVSIFGGDGYVCRCDPTDPDLVYFEMQDGGMGRRHLKTGEVTRIGPKVVAKGTPKHRFNWNTPYILSSHNPKIFYCGGEYVFKSLDRGENLKIISPDITMTKRGSATAIAESPKNLDVLWAGTDDGAIWVTRDGGQKWAYAEPLVRPGDPPRLGDILPGPRWVATIEASRFKEGRAYACFDGHRSDDDKPYLFVTEDFGTSWKNITSNLPAVGSTRCLREDVENPDLLYCGTEFGVFASIDRGQSWTRINSNLPTVAVHEIAVHPTAGEIVAATHGRSLWILDVSALRQMKPETSKKDAHLFKPQPTVRWVLEPTHGKTNRRFVGTNPPLTPQIYYTLSKPAGKVAFEVRDVEGKVLSKWTGAGKAGLNKTTWDMTRPLGDGAKDDEKKVGKGKKGGFGPLARRFASPGEYRVVMNVDGVEQTTTLRLEADPNIPAGSRPAEEELPAPKVD